jgi:hypothetical protein
MILVVTNRHLEGQGCHRWYQSHYGCNTSRMIIFVKTYGEETRKCPYKDYSSLNRWQANIDLLSAIYFL